MQSDLIEIIVITYNSAAHIGACVDSIVAARALPIIVDNGSSDDTLEIARARCSEAKIIATGQNLGYGRAMNLGFRVTRGEFVVLSNPDVIFLRDSISQMVDLLKENPNVGLTGPQQMFPDRSWQRSYGDLPGIWSGIKEAVGIKTFQNKLRKLLWLSKIGRKPKEVPYVDGAVVAVRRDAFLEMSGFDEHFYFYSEESDLCARLRKAGWRVMFLPTAEVIHVRGAASTKLDCSERFVRYMVTAQLLLARKHLAPRQARLYARLQILHFLRLSLIYRALNWLTRRDEPYTYKICMFDVYTRIWRELSSCKELSYDTPRSEGIPMKCDQTVKAK
jgi:GT2 family glycosyltransferase